MEDEFIIPVPGVIFSEGVSGIAGISESSGKMLERKKFFNKNIKDCIPGRIFTTEIKLSLGSNCLCFGNPVKESQHDKGKDGQTSTQKKSPLIIAGRIEYRTGDKSPGGTTQGEDKKVDTHDHAIGFQAKKFGYNGALQDSDAASAE